MKPKLTVKHNPHTNTKQDVKWKAGTWYWELTSSYNRIGLIKINIASWKEAMNEGLYYLKMITGATS